MLFRSGRLDLDVAVLIQEGTHPRYQLCSPLEHLAGRQTLVLDLQRRSDEVCVPVTPPQLRVGKPVHLVRHRQQSLCKELQLFDMYRHLAGVRRESIAFYAAHIAVIHELPKLPALVLVKRVRAVILYQRHAALLRTVDLQF